MLSPRSLRLPLLLSLLLLAPSLGGCLPAENTPAPPVAVDTSESEIPELSSAVKASLAKADKDDIAAYYGLYSMLAESVRDAALTTNADIHTLISYSNTKLGITGGKYPPFSKVAGEALDQVAGTAGKAQKVNLTDELRTSYYRVCQAISVGCRQALD